MADNVYMAKLAEQAERYEEMVEYMKKVATAASDDLSLEVCATRVPRAIYLPRRPGLHRSARPAQHSWRMKASSSATDGRTQALDATDQW